MGQFEPLQPKGSVYLAPSRNSMGILLLKSAKRKKIVPNPVLRTLNIVYKPDAEDAAGTASGTSLPDPSNVGISLSPINKFEAELSSA